MNIHDICPELPRKRRECPKGPCPHVACRFHLWTERVVKRGTVVDLRETALFGNPDHTCVLHETTRGPKTLEEVAKLLHLSRERIRQIEEECLTRLRDADMGILRDLLDAVKERNPDACFIHDDPEEQCVSGEDKTEDAHDDEPNTDESGAPEGADEPVSDDTGSLPWSEPTFTDDKHKDSYKSSMQRLRRAIRKASEANPFWCPYCGRSYPGVRLDGHERRGCPNPRCRARAWGDRARELNRHKQGIAPEIVAAIRAEYRPGEHGYRALAREHGLSVATVSSILRRTMKKESDGTRDL